MVYSKFMQIETELISIEYAIVYVYAFSAYVCSQSNVHLTFFMCSKLMHNFVPMKTKFDEVAAFLCHGNHKMFLKDVKKRLKDLNHTLGRGEGEGGRVWLGRGGMR